MSFFLSVFWLLLGAIIGAAAVIFRHVTKEIAQKRKNASCPEFYVNMVVTNKNAIMDAQVDEHHNKKQHPQIRVGKFHVNINPLNFGAVEKGIAHDVVSDDKFMLELSTQVAAGMKDKFSPQKINATGEVCFVRGCYAVIGVTIHKIDAPFLLGQNLDERKMSALTKVVHVLGYWMGEDNVKFGIRSQLTKIVVDQSVKSMGDATEKLLHDQNGVEANVVVKSNEDQPHFFYDLVKPQKDTKAKDDKITSAKLDSEEAQDGAGANKKTQ